MGVGNLVHLKVIVDELDSVLEGVPECGVPRAVDVLVFEEEESLGASDAVVAANIVGPPVLASEGALHTLALSDVVLVGREPGSQVLLVLHSVALLPFCEVFQ